MGNTEKNIESALARFSELSKKGLGKAKESIVQSSHTVRIKFDINSLERERKRLLESLGLELFEAVKGGKLKSKLFDETISNIDDIDSKLEEKGNELAAVGESQPAASPEKISRPESKGPEEEDSPEEK